MSGPLVDVEFGPAKIYSSGRTVSHAACLDHWSTSSLAQRRPIRQAELSLAQRGEDTFARNGSCDVGLPPTRSILKGLELLKKGIIWRVGNGEDIKIWDDPWLPRGSTRRPITPRRGIILSRVADLLCPDTGQWDEELVRELFWTEDVPIILALPTHVEMQDVATWHYDPKGLFSVKSAYRLWCDDQQRCSVNAPGEASSGHTGDGDNVWSGIWKMEGPN